MISKKVWTGIACFAALSFALATAAQAESIRAGGTGGATELLRQLLSKFASAESPFEVVPSLGTTGGIRALADGKLDIAVSGRQLKEEEKARGLKSEFTVRTPHVLVTSYSKPVNLKRSEVPSFYRNADAAWPDGTRIRIALRPKSDSENEALFESFPGMELALKELRTRPDLPIAATDQDNADWAEKSAASLVSTTYTQVKLEKRKLQLIKIDDVEPTLENLENGTYPIEKKLYFIVAENPKPQVAKFMEFLRSAAGAQALREAGVVAVKK
jgi:phosphate transport system substrate-binding protein